MNAKEFVSRLLGHYPESTHPDAQAIGDMRRLMNTWRFGPEQTQELFDRVIAACAYFPRVAEIVTEASRLCLPMRDKPKERVWLLFRDEQGRSWAKRGPYTYVETTQEQDKRYYDDAIDKAEGIAIYLEEYAKARAEHYTGAVTPLQESIQAQAEAWGIEVEVDAGAIADYDDGDPFSEL